MSLPTTGDARLWDIEVQLETILKTISTINGYRTSFATVRRENFDPLADNADLPALSVTYTGFRDDVDEDVPINRRRKDPLFRIVAWLREDDRDEGRRKIINAAADVELCTELARDPGGGGAVSLGLPYVNRVKVVRDRIFEGSTDVSRGLWAAALILLVQYDYDRADP